MSIDATPNSENIARSLMYDFWAKDYCGDEGIRLNIDSFADKFVEYLKQNGVQVSFNGEEPTAASGPNDLLMYGELTRRKWVEEEHTRLRKALASLMDEPSSAAHGGIESTYLRLMSVEAALGMRPHDIPPLTEDKE